MGKIEAVDDAVNVDVPGPPLSAPLDLSESTATMNAGLPELTAAESTEAGVEAVDLRSEWAVVGAESQSEEASGFVSESVDDVGRENAAAFSGTRNTEAVATRAAAEAVFVGSTEGLVDVSISSATFEGNDTCDGLHRAAEGGVNQGPIVGPARVTEAF